MKVELINAYSLSNIGDLAIADTLAQLLHPHQTFINPLKMVNTDIKSPNIYFSNQIADKHISIGGDIFNNGRPNLITKRFLSNIFDIKKNTESTILFGQTIPDSCKGFAFNLLARTLRELKNVTVRDSYSYSKLKSKNIQANLSYDTVFGLEINYEKYDESINQWLSDQGIYDLSKTACFSLREFDVLYPHDQDHLKKIVQSIKKLETRGWVCAVLIQSIESYKANNDLYIATELQKYCPLLKIINPFLLSDVPLIDSYAYLLAKAGIAITVRYHSAIFRLLGGRQPFNLHYSIKGQDLKNRLGLVGQSIDDPLDDISRIEATAELAFDPNPIKKQVKSDFDFAWKQLTDN